MLVYIFYFESILYVNRFMFLSWYFFFRICGYYEFGLFFVEFFVVVFIVVGCFCLFFFCFEFRDFVIGRISVFFGFFIGLLIFFNIFGDSYLKEFLCESVLLEKSKVCWYFGVFLFLF